MRKIKRDKNDFNQVLLSVSYDFKKVNEHIERKNIEYDLILNPVIKNELPEELKSEFDVHMGKVLDIITVGFTKFATKTIKAEVERLQEQMGEENEV